MSTIERKKASIASEEHNGNLKWTVPKDRPRLGAEAELPLLEKLFYFVVYVTFFGLAAYKIYIFPLDNPNELNQNDFKDSWTFTRRRKDISDFEWNFWTNQFGSLVITSLLHALGSRLVSALVPQHRMAYFAIFQLISIWLSFGWKPVLLFVGHNVLYYIASQVKSILFCWVLGLLVLVTCVNNSLSNWQFYKITSNSTEGDFVLFTSVMCQLRGMSFCLDACLAAAKKEKLEDDVKGKNAKDEVSYGFVDLLGYNFYLPLFCNGPVVLYNEFYMQVKKPVPQLSVGVLGAFAWDAVKTLWWFGVMELGFHYLYITSLARDPYIIESVPILLSTGLMYTVVLLFSIKYVIFYRFAGMFARLDGINPPGIPKCVLRLYLFTEMWKSFDQGLHIWLKKYVYIPLGGSRKGIFRQILSSAATFAYVYYWHGAYDYLLYWVVVQWCGVFSEAMAGKLLKTKAIQHLETEILSPAATRRLHAIFGVFTITTAILSNCVFLVNHPSVVEYLKAVYIKGGIQPGLLLAAVTYCLVQVIMEVQLLIRQRSDPKKHL